MKTVILAGGLGSRLFEVTESMPKPLVPIGQRPVIWHIMNIYAAGGFKDFTVCLGYKSELIKEFFLNYRRYCESMTVRLRDGAAEFNADSIEDWTVRLLDTGVDSMTGGRLRRAMLDMGRQPCLLTYGDGVADIDLKKVVAFHKKHKKLATLTAVRPPARFGGLALDGDRVSSFEEKPQLGEGWINGGFFVLEPAVVDYIAGDATVFEKEPLERLAREGQLMAYRHEGFWQCMDTVRDVKLLESLWHGGKAPWKVWK